MERIKEDRPITIKDDKGNLNRCIADIVSVRLLALSTLSSMSASDELDDNQVRQMLFDLESAYNAFNRFLHSS
ncbi:hypothetical protein GOODEAATRI_000442 [Goodea atripinnis]|uniref:VPS28 C-terminal domain-containing protein n=1 Tax=Goodea atripinnis TaxID=208336 RepID=A0ABV0MN63_9TELE